MVPQITFNPLKHRYYPGTEYWHTACKAPEGTHTSGITQPPVMALSAPMVATAFLAGNEAMSQAERNDLSVLLKSTINFLTFLRNYRDPESSGLITVVHPWESGLDNAPPWDQPLSAPELDIDKILQAVQ